MKQFHVYRLPGGTLVVCLQSDLVDSNTKVVAPLIPESDRFPPLKRLEPVFEIDGARHSMRTAELAAILANIASGDPVADLSDCEYEIRGALDMVFSGF